MNTKRKDKIKAFFHFDTQDIRFKIWVSFLLFILVMLVLVWLVEGVFFQSNYERTKKKEMIYIANKVSLHLDDDDLSTIIDDLAYRYSLNIYITDSNYRLLESSLSTTKFDLGFHNYSLLENNKIIIIKNEQFKTQMFVYSLFQDSTRIIVTAPIDVVTSVSQVLLDQMINISILLVIVGLLISMYLSKKLSKPLVSITAKAKELARGNYNVTFDDKGYQEIENLSSTLNYATTELAKTDTLRRELLANVSHDLKTPLTMIKSYAEIIMDIPHTKEEQDKKLGIIMDEVDRLNILVNDIINLSKLESNVEDLKIEHVNLSKLVETIVSRFDYLQEKDNYIIDTHIEQNMYVDVDENRISQAIYNLIGNAINYTGDDKKIVINLYAHDNHILFEVKDTGKGIAPDDLDKIWDKYYKVDVNHKRKIVSTGLGLNIVKNILNNHKLVYGVNSILKKGSTFYIEFEKSVK